MDAKVGQMKRTAAILLLVICSVVTSSAQTRDIVFDTLKPMGYEPTPIGVEEMRFFGTTPITANDSTYMQYTATVLRRDLDFYADFELTRIDSFFIRMYDITEMDLLSWERLGADYVVKLEVEFPGRNMLVRWRLYDVLHSQRIARGSFEYNKVFWRELGHDIANEVVRTLTGDKGIFRTKIVYIKKLGKAKELFMADYDGSNEKQLTSNGSINISPAFAPDKEEVYFISYVEGNPKLFKVDVNTNAVTKVAEFPGIVAAPAISPDGKRIACVVSDRGNSDIYVLDLKGKVLKRLTSRRSIESSPTWSPDGREIAFSSDRTGSPQVYIMDADGLDLRRRTFQGGYNDSPLWSMRGDRITLVSRTKTGRFNLASIDTSGTDYRPLTNLGTNENPHFSPDGKHIIFSSSRLGGLDIYTMDVSGRNQRRLTRSNNCSNPAWGPLR
jgi:TolB protein